MKKNSQTAYPIQGLRLGEAILLTGISLWCTRTFELEYDTSSECVPPNANTFYDLLTEQSKNCCLLKSPVIRTRLALETGREQRVSFLNPSYRIVTRAR